MGRDCEYALAEVYTYLDGEAGWFRSLQIKRHLRKCGGCLGMYSFEERLRIVIREKTREEPPSDLVERLQDFLRDNG